MVRLRKILKASTKHWRTPRRFVVRLMSAVPRMPIRNLLSARRVVLIVVVLCVLAASVPGLLRFRIDTSIQSLLPAGEKSISELEDKARAFGGDPIVVLLESQRPRQMLAEPDQLRRLLGMEGKLSRLPDVAATYGPATVLNQIAAATQNMLARISGERDALRTQTEKEARRAGKSESEARAAGERAIVEFDRRYGALLVQGLPVGLPSLHNPKFVQNVLYDDSGKSRPEWRFVVPNDRSVAVLIRPRADMDQSQTRELISSVRSTVTSSYLATSRVTVTGIPAVTAGMADEVARELPLLGLLAVLAMLLRFILVPAPVGWLRRLWPLGAALTGTALTLSVFGWLGLSMSLGAVALLPLLLGIGSSFPLYLRAVRDRRTVIALSLGSAAAFASLGISPLPFVRELGLALAAGVILTVVAALVVRRGPVDPPSSNGPAERSTYQLRQRARLARWVIVVCAVLVAGLGWACLSVVKMQADPRELARGLPELSDAQYAEQMLGSSGEVNVVLEGPDVLSPPAWQWGVQAEKRITARHGQNVRPILTLPSLFRFLGNSPTTEQLNSAMQLLPSYLTTAVVTQDHHQAVMTFGLKIQDLGQQISLLEDVRATLPPAPPGFTPRIVGLPVAADRGYALLSSDRYPASLAGIVAAGGVLLLGLRRRADAFRGVAAAVLATGWTLMALWLIGLALSPLTLALGSLTTVTAAEFSVLLSRVDRTGDTRLRRVVTWACVTSTLGYLALVPSSLWLLRQFGLVLAASVLLSYLAALLVVQLVPRARETGRAVEVRHSKPLEVK